VDFKNSLHRDEMRFVQTSFKLYQQLFQPLMKHLKNVKNIAIVADGALSYLPFDAFLIKAPQNWDYDFSTLEYLIYKYQIAYQQSATSFLHPKPVTSHRKKALALAPLFTENIKKSIANQDSLYLQLNPLLVSQQLLKDIKRLYSIKLLTGKAATFSNFLNHKNAPLLHFATHTLVNEVSPLESKIALARSDTSDNGYLLLKDLYQMSLNAELVVLGSCESGQGVFNRGEGMISLAYGFDLAGANSTVYSLWAVDERATVDLMRLFYQNLAKGWDKDKALHEAKLEYLQVANEVTSEPFYWASFVLNGHTRPLEQVKRNKGSWWVWILVGFGILVFGYFRFFRR
jgi:CHAT domain-containing protein